MRASPNSSASPVSFASSFDPVVAGERPARPVREMLRRATKAVPVPAALAEPLEGRRMFAVAAFPGTTGANVGGDDVITLFYQENINGNPIADGWGVEHLSPAGKTTYYFYDVTGISIDAGDGNDDVLVDSTVQSYFDVTLTGNLGNDTLMGGNASELIDASAGTDLIYGSPGADSLAGGNGTDTIDLSTMTNYRFNSSLDGLANDGVYGTGSTALWTQSHSAERLRGSNLADTLTGSSGDNFIWGGGGNDSIFGVGGFDSIYGEAGNDTLDGGSDNDFIVGGSGADLLQGQGGDDVFDMLDGAGTDTANGGSGTDSLFNNTKDAGDVFNQ
jgi:Ca2+-binding RTX toxin-like protein